MKRYSKVLIPCVLLLSFIFVSCKQDDGSDFSDEGSPGAPIFIGSAVGGSTSRNCQVGTGASFYYVAVTDAGGRTVTDNNAGANYNFTVSGIGLIIWLIIGAVAVLIIVACLCWAIQRRRQKSAPATLTPASTLQTGRSIPDGSLEYGKEPAPPSSKPNRTGFCYHCGAPLTPNAIYCGHCGRPTE